MVILTPDEWNKKFHDVASTSTSELSSAGESSTKDINILNENIKTLKSLIHRIETCKTELNENVEEVKRNIQEEFSNFINLNLLYEKCMLDNLQKFSSDRLYELKCQEVLMKQKLANLISGNAKPSSSCSDGMFVPPVLMNFESTLGKINLSDHVQLNHTQSKFATFSISPDDNDAFSCRSSLMDLAESETSASFEILKEQSEDELCEKFSSYATVDTRSNVETISNTTNISEDFDCPELEQHQFNDISRWLQRGKKHSSSVGTFIECFQKNYDDDNSSRWLQDSQETVKMQLNKEDEGCFSSYFQSIKNHNWLAGNNMEYVDQNHVTNSIAQSNIENMVSNWFKKNVFHLSQEDWLKL